MFENDALAVEIGRVMAGMTEQKRKAAFLGAFTAALQLHGCEPWEVICGVRIIEETGDRRSKEVVLSLEELTEHMTDCAEYHGILTTYQEAEVLVLEALESLDRASLFNIKTDPSGKLFLCSLNKARIGSSFSAHAARASYN